MAERSRRFQREATPADGNLPRVASRVQTALGSATRGASAMRASGKHRTTAVMAAMQRTKPSVRPGWQPLRTA